MILCDEKITFNDFIDKAKKEITKGYIIAALTDEYIVDYWSNENPDVILNNKDKKILEVRIFDDKKECRISRYNISDDSKDFIYRKICDIEEKRDSYDEWQFLDIDETIPLDENGKVTSTGGGKYKLPLDSSVNAKILIRYYLGKYEETGQSRVEDWRVVTFKEGE